MLVCCRPFSECSSHVGVLNATCELLLVMPTLALKTAYKQLLEPQRNRTKRLRSTPDNGRSLAVRAECCFQLPTRIKTVPLSPESRQARQSMLKLQDVRDMKMRRCTMSKLCNRATALCFDCIIRWSISSSFSLYMLPSCSALYQAALARCVPEEQ